MSLEAITWAYKTQVGNSAQKAVLLVLANYADENDSAYPGIVRIATMTQLSERTVQRAIADMEEAGVFTVQRKVNSVNRYRLNLDWAPARGGDTMTPPGGDTMTSGGDTVTCDTKKTPSRGHETTVPAERVEVSRPERPTRRRGKGLTTPADELESTGSFPADDKPAEVTPIRKPTVGGLAKTFEREARTRYKLGDPRRITNMTALRDNIARWRDDGVALEDVAAAIDAFWAAGMVREGQEPWKRFITTITVTLGKATAPDITNPDYYTDPQEDEMDAAEKWLKENGL